MASAPKTALPLPQELINAIIDHLHADSHALATCSLVAHTWLPPARRHLFHTLTIDSASCAALAVLVQAPSSTIAPHVRAITTIGVRGKYVYDGGEIMQAEICALVCDIAAHAPLETLNLDTVHKAVLVPGRFPHVTTLALSASYYGTSFADIAAAAAALPRLRRLAVAGHCALRQHRAADPTVLQHITHLALNLTVSGYYEHVYDWVHTQALPSLRTLRLSTPDADVYRPWRVPRDFTHAAHALSTLEVDNRMIAVLDLSTSTTLRTLRLILIHNPEHGKSAALASAARLPALDAVLLEFGKKFAPEQYDLPGIDAQLTQFVALRSVTVVLPTVLTGEGEGRVRELLVGCDKRGMVSFREERSFEQ